MTHPLLEAANAELTKFEAMLEDARDVLFNLAQDITNNVPPSTIKTITIERIEQIRSKL